jgi:hypothetical protein
LPAFSWCSVPPSCSGLSSGFSSGGAKRWREAVARDPASAWGAPWLGEHLSAHPYLTVGVLLLFVVLSSGLVVLMLLGVSKWLAARLTDRARPD